jgi:hypothetical protein
MIQSHKLVQMGLVTGLTALWILIYIDLPYPPSRWNLLAAVGIPSAVALSFETFRRVRGSGLGRLGRFFLWLGFLFVLEFVSVALALAIHGT